jgi:hypothetical protein
MLVTGTVNTGIRGPGNGDKRVAAKADEDKVSKMAICDILE